MFVSENPLLLVVVSINNWDSVPESAHGLFIVLFVAGKMLTYMPNQSPLYFWWRKPESFQLQVDNENDCQSKMRSLVDKLMTQQGTLMSLEGLFADLRLTLNALCVAGSKLNTRYAWIFLCSFSEKQQTSKSLSSILPNMMREEMQEILWCCPIVI